MGGFCKKYLKILIRAWQYKEKRRKPSGFAPFFLQANRRRVFHEGV